MRRLPSDQASPVFFLEDREDLVVSRSGEAPAAVTRSRRRGLALRAGGRLLHLADPSPGDVGRLVPGLQAPSGRDAGSKGRSADDQTAVPSRIPESLWLACLDELLREVRRAIPPATSMARAVVFEQQVLLMQRDGTPVHERRRAARVRLDCDPRGGVVATVSGEAVLAGDPARDEPRLRDLAHRVARRAEERLAARDHPGGELPVVLAAGAGGILVHELIGHALEADTVQRGDSWLARADGAGIWTGPEALTVIDDPRRGRASWRIDDEGEASRPVPLLRSGRVAGLLHDGSTAGVSGSAPTGHGRCSSYREPVRPRMGCTFIAPGRLAPEEVIEGIRNGVYVRRMEAGHTDTRSGTASFRVTDSDRIRDGRIEAPLTPHLLRVDGGSMLSTVERVADDLVFDRCIGGCHRDGQPLAISVGAPTICIGVARVQV